MKVILGMQIRTTDPGGYGAYENFKSSLQKASIEVLRFYPILILCGPTPLMQNGLWFGIEILSRIALTSSD